MTHAFVFQCLVQVLQLSAPFNLWNNKAESSETLFKSWPVLSPVIFLLITFSISQRRTWATAHRLQVQNSSLHPYIQHIIFKTSVISLSLKIKTILTAWLQVTLLKRIDMCQCMKGLDAEKGIQALAATHPRGKNYLKGTEGRHLTLRKLCTSDKQIVQLC